jgi:hypothetical protein
MNLAKIFVLNLFLFVLICNVYGQDALIEEQKPSVTLCEIESNPELYLNKEVKVDAVYVVGFEMGWLDYPKSCVRQKENLYKITYKFDEKFDELTEKKVLRKFNKLLNKKGLVTTLRKVRGVYTVKIEPFEKTNPNDRRFEFQIRIMSLVSIDSN